MKGRAEEPPLGDLTSALARGPMALPELTSYKYVVHGAGQVRE